MRNSPTTRRVDDELEIGSGGRVIYIFRMTLAAADACMAIENVFTITDFLHFYGVVSFLR